MRSVSPYRDAMVLIMQVESVASVSNPLSGEFIADCKYKSFLENESLPFIDVAVKSKIERRKKEGM